MKWEDITTYSRGCQERIPRIWQCPLSKNYKLTVHRHVYYENTWFVTVHETDIDAIDLHTDDLTEAKAKAVNILIDFLNKKKNEIEDVLAKING